MGVFHVLGYHGMCCLLCFYLGEGTFLLQSLWSQVYSAQLQTTEEMVMHAPEWFLNYTDARLDWLKSFWHSTGGGVAFYTIVVLFCLYIGYIFWEHYYD